MRFQVIYGSGAIRLRPLGALCWKARCTKPCTDKTLLSPRLGNLICIIVPAYAPPRHLVSRWDSCLESLTSSGRC